MATGAFRREAFDPARVLAQVAALRAVVALHWEESRAAPFCTLCAEGALVWGWPCTTMRHIAAIWADHADYDQEWRP